MQITPACLPHVSNRTCNDYYYDSRTGISDCDRPGWSNIPASLQGRYTNSLFITSPPNNDFNIFTQTALPKLLKCFKISKLTPWNRVRPEKLIGLRLVRKFPTVYRTTALTSACHQSLCWGRPIQAMPPHSTKVNKTLIPQKNAQITPLLHTQSSFHHRHFFTSQRSTLLPIYQYQNDQQAQPGTIQSNECPPSPPCLSLHPCFFVFNLLFILQWIKRVDKYYF